MSEGYCTIDDVRRVLRKADLPGDAAQDVQIVTDAIAAQTEWFEKTFKRHWYDPDASSNLLPTELETRDDEEDIPTGGAFLAGEPATPKTWQGDYTRIELARRDATTISELLVRDADGGYTDWVASSDYEGGRWPSALGKDYVLRVNNGGWSHLYLDTTNLLKEDEDDEYYLDSFSNAVYVTFEYGHEGIPKTARRGIAFRAAADLVEKPSFEIPNNVQVYNVEALAEKFETKAEELLGAYR